MKDYKYIYYDNGGIVLRGNNVHIQVELNRLTRYLFGEGAAANQVFNCGSGAFIKFQTKPEVNKERCLLTTKIWRYCKRNSISVSHENFKLRNVCSTIGTDFNDIIKTISMKQQDNNAQPVQSLNEGEWTKGKIVVKNGRWYTEAGDVFYTNWREGLNNKAEAQANNDRLVYAWNNIDRLEKENAKLQETNKSFYRAFESLTPGGSEYWNDVAACISYVKRERHDMKEIFKSQKEENKALKDTNKMILDKCHAILLKGTNENLTPAEYKTFIGAIAERLHRIISTNK